MIDLKVITNPQEIFRELPTLETPRLKLRRLMTRDANDVFEYASDPDVARFVTWEHHRSVADALHFVRMILNTYSRGEPSPWGIVYKEDQKLIGTGGFHWWQVESARAELGYAISARYWNKGIMTEALGAMMEFGFEKMLLNRIEARCYIKNMASERVLLKGGMKYEGIMRESLYVKGEFQDLKLYSILKSEWNGVLKQNKV